MNQNTNTRLKKLEQANTTSKPTIEDFIRNPELIKERPDDEISKCLSRCQGEEF